MRKDEEKKMENSQLLCYFLISRDNLVTIKKRIYDNPDNEEIKDLYDIEEKEYTALLNEIYRRMNYGRKKR